MLSFITIFVATSVLFSQASSACVDEYSKCGDFVQYCHLKGQWEAYMRKNCKKTCPGHCDEPVSKTIEPKSTSKRQEKRKESESASVPRTSESARVRVYKNKDYANTRKETGTSRSRSGRCGLPDIFHNRAGIDAKKGSWPWLISLGLRGRSGHICGGSLVSPGWVLTARSCVEGVDHRQLEVIAGEHNRYKTEGTEQYRTVRRMILHPGSTQGRYKNDLALLELNSPVKKNSQVEVVCLPQEGTSPGVGMKCYLPGWGTMASPRNPSPLLQQADLPVVQNGYCFHDRRHVCAGRWKGVLSNACRGDRGSPLVCRDSRGRWMQHGVAGVLVRYCENYAAFTKVSDHIRWISSYINA